MCQLSWWGNGKPEGCGGLRSERLACFPPLNRIPYPHAFTTHLLFPNLAIQVVKALIRLCPWLLNPAFVTSTGRIIHHASAGIHLLNIYHTIIFPLSPSPFCWPSSTPSPTHPHHPRTINCEMAPTSSPAVYSSTGCRGIR